MTPQRCSEIPAHAGTSGPAGVTPSLRCYLAKYLPMREAGKPIKACLTPSPLTSGTNNMHRLVQQCKVRHVRALVDPSLKQTNPRWTTSKVEADLSGFVQWNIEHHPRAILPTNVNVFTERWKKSSNNFPMFFLFADLRRGQCLACGNS